VSSLLNELRGDVVGNTGTLSTADDRQNLVNEIDDDLQQLLSAANTQSQGQYLFSGSKSQVKPYDFNGQYVQYSGNQGSLQTYVDLDRLFDTNVAGTDVFGGVSAETQGTALKPQISSDTLLSTINGGAGLSKNAAITLSVNTGTSTVSSVVDLSKAVTLGDVARSIERGAPAGTHITVSASGSGLTITSSSGNLIVGNVGEGRAANDLGIATPTNAAPTTTILGSNLAPAVLNTTSLDSLLGTKAQVTLQSVGSNNDLVLTANKNGQAFNGVNVVFKSDVAAGHEAADYDATTDPLHPTLTVHIQSGYTTAKQAAAAITAEGTFTAVSDYHDQSSAAQAGTNQVFAQNFTSVTAGGSGEALDTASGLIISNGGKTTTLDTSSVKTVEGLLNLLNGSGLGLVATINATHDGINVQSNLSGADLTIGENGGQLASQLGIRTYTADTKLADFNNGLGAQASGSLQHLDPSKLDNLTIVARDGTTLNVSLAGVTSLQGVADAINHATDNNTGSTAVVASVSVNGNRIELVDASTSATGKLTVKAPTGNLAAQYLGLVPAGADQSVSTATTDTTQAVGLLALNTAGNATISLTAKSGGAAAGAEGQGQKQLVIVDGTPEGATYDASTDTITATVDIIGGHNTAADLANVLNNSTAFDATVVSKGADAIAATNTGSAALNGGQDAGKDTLSGGNVLGNDVVITARDGTKLYVDIGDAKTVQDVINRINNNSANNTGTTKVVAKLATMGNGIQLVDESTATTGALTVQSAEGSQAAEFLGFVPSGQSQATSSTTDSQGNYVLQSADTHSVKTESVFDTLIRLKQALQANDTGAIGSSLSSLDTDISRVTFARADIGSRLQSLDVISSNLKDENVQLKSSLSDDTEVDLAQAISDMTARQYSMQASLQTAASMLQLSLLNYL
jgi:flagellin-like hook-associated protein FlgL